MMGHLKLGSAFVAAIVLAAWATPVATNKYQLDVNDDDQPTATNDDAHINGFMSRAN